MQELEKPSYKDLLLMFLKLGFTALGGPAMVNHVRKNIVEKKQWLDARTFDNGMALCQTIPGAIVMQVSAYCGLKIKGFKGALVCFIGFGFPAFLVMLILSVLYVQFRDLSTVESILATLRVFIAAIVLHATFTFGKRFFHTINDVVIALISAALFLTKLHPALVIIISGLLGAFISKNNGDPIGQTGITRTLKYFFVLLGLLALSLLILFFVSPNLFKLALTMLRIDVFAFGGGFAAVPVFYHEIIDVNSWLDKKTFLDGIILGQITPGSIIITATFVGYLKFGLTGAILATLFVFTPSFLILMALVPFFDKLRTYPQFNKIINGVLCSFVGLLLIVTYHFGIEIHWSASSIILAVAALAALLLNVDVIWVILGGILVSLFM